MDWTLRKKILVGYGIVLLLLLLTFVWAFANLFRLGQASDAILSENYRSIRAADNMINALERQDSGVLLYILDYEQEGIEQFQSKQSDFMKWLARAEDNVTIEGEADLIHRIDSSYAAYFARFTHLLRDSTTAGAPALTSDSYHEVLLPDFMAVRDLSTELRDLNQQTMVAASDRASRVARRAVWSMGLIGLSALVLGFIFSLVLTNRLVRPIRRLRAATRQIAAGNYEVEVEAETSDELGHLAEQFNEMAAQLRAYHELNVERIIAEQRKSEAILQSIDDGLVVIGDDFTVLNTNPVAEKALNLGDQKAIGRHFLEVIKSEELFSRVREVVETGQPATMDESENFFSTEQNGAQRHYQYFVTPVYGASDDMLGVILLLRDVTKLKELDRLKSEFVANASHELKTPLTGIEMSLGLLQEQADQLNEEDRELLGVAREDAGRIRMLVNDLLDLSKIESGRLELDTTPVPVALLFEKALQNFTVQAEQHGVQLLSETAESLPPVQADATKITWVLTNLISNALRYTDAGGYIRLSAERAGSKVHISVEDSGAGIPYEYQAKIFDKFVQVDGEKQGGGSGLGLAICKEMVEAHGGRIWVDSTPGEGTTFTFTLPTAPEA